MADFTLGESDNLTIRNSAGKVVFRIRSIESKEYLLLEAERIFRTDTGGGAPSELPITIAYDGIRVYPNRYDA